MQSLSLQDLKQLSPRLGIIARNQPKTGHGSFSGDTFAYNHFKPSILYHETDLQIHKHYLDTWGYTDQVFGMAHLLGFRFAPRIRDLGNKRLYSFEKPATYPGLESFLGGTVNVKQMETYWDDLLRLTKYATAPTKITAIEPAVLVDHQCEQRHPELLAKQSARTRVAAVRDEPDRLVSRLTHPEG